MYHEYVEILAQLESLQQNEKKQRDRSRSKIIITGSSVRGSQKVLVLYPKAVSGCKQAGLWLYAISAPALITERLEVVDYDVTFSRLN